MEITSGKELGHVVLLKYQVIELYTQRDITKFSSTHKSCRLSAKRLCLPKKCFIEEVREKRSEEERKYSNANMC